VWITLWRWIRSNSLLILITIVLVALPIGLSFFVLYKSNFVNSSLALVAHLGTLIVSTLPAIVLLKNLIRSGEIWLKEARLALKEYEKSVQEKNKQRELRIEKIIEQRILEDENLKNLEQKVKQLEQQAHDQESIIPINQYETLADFVLDRTESNIYKKHLGLMHQVKEDLLDLSNKLLPPSQYDPRFQGQVENLKKVFPRGPARIVIYIDDLDRCPPDRVVEVLEAIQLLVKTPLFIAVLAIDERYITRALEKHYDGVLSRHGRPSGTDYLEKIIQLPYRVRPIMANTLETYLRSQMVIQDSATGGAKFSEFSRQEFNILLACCQQVNLSPRTLKRLINVYKLFKIVCRTRSTKLSLQSQKATLALLALSGRYPHLIRDIFENIETCFEENRIPKSGKLTQKTPKAQSPLRDFFDHYQLSNDDQYLKREFEKLKHDVLQTDILPPNLSLEDLTHEVFNLIRSFSFVGEISENPEELGIDSHTSNRSNRANDHTS
jgi:polyhydroxyalkanoate synthesis regulator phasin